MPFLDFYLRSEMGLDSKRFIYKARVSTEICIHGFKYKFRLNGKFLHVGLSLNLYVDALVPNFW